MVFLDSFLLQHHFLFLSTQKWIPKRKIDLRKTHFSLILSDLLIKTNVLRTTSVVGDWLTMKEKRKSLVFFDVSLFWRFWHNNILFLCSYYIATFILAMYAHLLFTNNKNKDNSFINIYLVLRTLCCFVWPVNW